MRALTLACALLLAPGAALAQSDPASEGRPLRVAAEAGGGVLGGVGGGLLGGAVGAASCSRESGLFCLGPVMVGAAVGGALGLGLGVWGAGTLADGEGGLGYTLLGTLGGVGTLGVGALLFDGLGWEPPEAVTGVLVVLLPLSFSIAAYELSHGASSQTGSRGTALMVAAPLRF